MIYVKQVDACQLLGVRKDLGVTKVLEWVLLSAHQKNIRLKVAKLFSSLLTNLISTLSH